MRVCRDFFNSQTFSVEFASLLCPLSVDLLTGVNRARDGRVTQLSFGSRRTNSARLGYRLLASVDFRVARHTSTIAEARAGSPRSGRIKRA